MPQISWRRPWYAVVPVHFIFALCLCGSLLLVGAAGCKPSSEGSRQTGTSAHSREVRSNEKLSFNTISRRHFSSNKNPQLLLHDTWVVADDGDSFIGHVASRTAELLATRGRMGRVRCFSYGEELPLNGLLPSAVVQVRLCPLPPTSPERPPVVLFSASNDWEKSGMFRTTSNAPPILDWLQRGTCSWTAPPNAKNNDPLDSAHIVEQVAGELSREIENSICDIGYVPCFLTPDELRSLWPPFVAPPQFHFLEDRKAILRMAGSRLLQPSMACWEFTSSEPPSLWFPQMRDELKATGWSVPSEVSRGTPLAMAIKGVYSLELFKKGTGLENAELKEGEPTRVTYVVKYQQWLTGDEYVTILRQVAQDPDKERLLPFLASWWHLEKQAVLEAFSKEPPSTVPGLIALGDLKWSEKLVEETCSLWYTALIMDRFFGRGDQADAILKRVEKAGIAPLPQLFDSKLIQPGSITLVPPWDRFTIPIVIDQPLYFHLGNPELPAHFVRLQVNAQNLDERPPSAGQIRPATSHLTLDVTEVSWLSDQNSSRSRQTINLGVDRNNVYRVFADDHATYTIEVAFDNERRVESDAILRETGTVTIRPFVEVNHNTPPLTLRSTVPSR